MKSGTTALLNLGFCREHGRGVKQDAAKAAEMYEFAIDAGEVEGLARLAPMHREERGVAQDASKAVELYQRAVSGGGSNAQIPLTVMCGKGLVGGRDWASALQLFLLTAGESDESSIAVVLSVIVTRCRVALRKPSAVGWATLVVKSG